VTDIQELLAIKEQKLIEETMTPEEWERQRIESEKKRTEAMKDSGLSAAEMNLGDTPYLMNISDDPSLAGLLVFAINEGKLEIGRNP